MKQRIIRLCLWLATKCGWRPPVPFADLDAYVVRGRVLCDQQEQTRPGTSGEYKRHQVYARLLTEFPGVAKRDLALAIELALR